MPPPEQLGAYNKALPGLTKQIVDMAVEAHKEAIRETQEDQSQSRFALEGMLAITRRGQTIGACCIGSGVLLAAVAMLLGHTVLAGTFFTVSLSAVVISAIKGDGLFPSPAKEGSDK